MNKGWSELNKTMQLQIKKKETFSQGIETLLTLRKEIMRTILDMKNSLSKEEFCAMPFPNANGYHSKTIAYSLWHIFRIEDIVVHSLIIKDTQILFSENYQEKIQSPIITTGNELVKQDITDFSSKLKIEELYHYIMAVDASTTRLLQDLSFEDLKMKMTEQDKERLKSLKVVSNDENAVWLIDYWCNKDIKGLIQMPFSRHWIMHVEACLRIKDKVHTDT